MYSTAIGCQDLTVDPVELVGQAIVLHRDGFQHPAAHRKAGPPSRAAGHPRLAAGRCAAGRADRGVGWREHNLVEAKRLTGDLHRQCDETLPDLGAGGLQRDEAVVQAAPPC